ncbi:1150_t:CDS:2, partial [Acaulospora colombiana]
IVQDNQLAGLADRLPSDDSLPASLQGDVQAATFFASSPFSLPSDIPTHAVASHITDDPVVSRDMNKHIIHPQQFLCARQDHPLLCAGHLTPTVPQFRPMPLSISRPQPALQQFGSPPPLESLSPSGIGSNGGSAFAPSLSHPSNAQVANS